MAPGTPPPEISAAARQPYSEAAENIPLDNMVVKEVKVRSVELTDAVAKDKPNYRSRSQVTLCVIILFVTLNGCMNGYDGSVMSSINAMDQFHEYYDVGRTGPTIGFVMAIYTAGQICGSIFSAGVIDTFGRKYGMAVGSAFIIIGSVVQATSQTLSAFIGGRFIVGFGVPMCTIAAPTYIVEMAYPTWRGLAGGLYNVLGWYIGSLKSPRWLFAKQKDDVAKSVLTKYHGNGSPDSAVVRLECEKIKFSLEAEAELTRGRWWDYKILVKNRANRYRMWILVLITVFSQFTGGAVISYFLPSILETVGITSSSQQLLMNALNTVFSFCGGIVGAFFVDKAGRRPLLLWGVFLSGLVYIPINVLAALSGGHIDTASGYAFIAMIFLYGIVMSFTWTPLQALYPAEILSTDIRAKGIAADKFVSGIASFINLYATPIALKDIGWKTYTIFLVLHFVHLVLMYFVTVETKGRSLEELEEIFNDPKPVQRSKQLSRVVVGAGVGVKVADA
ncbi:Lactose permease [Colletotrichum gloeosporioides]|uniref:Lactose permease n=1 Tax=Colletotrichum gloeosporioides TaxID=474922 RepID=A0A8H4FJ60_COLGL|nr:Lactose permease [Colletotrichum gloeosporioides]KAF3803796.1 Lactose permease [Colletotrichum gloeosporioides]